MNSPAGTFRPVMVWSYATRAAALVSGSMAAGVAEPTIGATKFRAANAVQFVFVVQSVRAVGAVAPARNQNVKPSAGAFSARHCLPV